MGRLHPLIRAVVVTASAIASTAAFAQPTSGAGVRALEQAGDAFGVRIGVEQIGLYSESQVRGLSLQDSGNYRVGGAYFVRVGNLIDPILAGVITRVGFNALEADFPAPSGIVEYRLKSPFTAPEISGELALREYGSRFADLSGAYVSPGRTMGLLVGGQIAQSRSSSGLEGAHYRIAALSEWRPNDATRVIAFGTLNDFDLEGSYGVTPKDGVLPPRMPHPRRYLPTWGDHDGQDINGGLIASVKPAADLTLNASAIYSRLDLDKSEFALMSVDRSGAGEVSIISNRPRDADAWALASGASWAHAAGRRLYAEIRARRTRNLTAPSVTQRVTGFDLREGLRQPPPPVLDRRPQTRDEAEQVTLSLGYQAAFKRLVIKSGVQRTHHRRTLTPPGERANVTRASPWLYDLSAIAALGQGFTLFATATRGLEDSGIAPSNAVNRNEVLPPVVARQQELGVRTRLTPDLTLITSAYSIEKPAAGFDRAGVYGLVGDLRHRGVEVSLAGRLRPGLRVVAGAAYLDARRSGVQVESGALSAEPPGTPKVQALAGLSWDVPGVEGLSLDGQVGYSTSRRVRSTGDLRTGPWTTVDVGALYAFRIDDADMALRLRVLNLLNDDQWIAQRSETLDRYNRRGVRLSLTARY